MNNIKKQISDLRKTTPKRIQWLLLVAAFILVLILLMILLGGDSSDKHIETPEDQAIELWVSPALDNDTLDWGNTPVAETRSQTFTLSTNGPVIISGVRLNNEISGLSASRQTCTNMGQIDSNTTCRIEVEYHPQTPLSSTLVALFIDWRPANQPIKMKHTHKITIIVGTTDTQQPKSQDTTEQAPTPAIIAEPTPVIKDTPQKIEEELSEIAPQNPFAEDAAPIIPAPLPSPKATPKETTEKCYDFAFPGYDLSGTQIGWIRPERGAYYFHPFSDTNCKNATGVYNPDNGIITDKDNRSKKIGTDAEHIGYTETKTGSLPNLSNPVSKKPANRATELQDVTGVAAEGGFGSITLNQKTPDVKYGTTGYAVFSTDPYDRTFVLRQYKPIPATIVSEVRADPSLYESDDNGNKKFSLPVRATVDRNVYSDNGRTIIIPTGTLLLGYLDGTLPGPYKAVGRMDIRWYQFVLPNGVEFNFDGGGDHDPFSADSQGRQGVPGYGSTDYVQQIVMPMLTSIVPAAVNLIAPIADTFVNQIDLDNNTVVQSGTVRSSELAKNEIINTWNQVAQKFMVDMLDNTTPPFSIAAGTRITVFAPDDLVITCGEDDDKVCSVKSLVKTTNKSNEQNRNERPDWHNKATAKYDDGTWSGQVAGFDMMPYCKQEKGVWTVDTDQMEEITKAGYDYSTVAFYCQSHNYEAKNNAKQAALYENQQSSGNKNSINYIKSQGDKTYNEQVLDLKYDEETGAIENPFSSTPSQAEETASAVIGCLDGTAPDENGCCTGEIYTNMGDQGFNCCPESGGDCFPPIEF